MAFEIINLLTYLLTATTTTTTTNNNNIFKQKYLLLNVVTKSYLNLVTRVTLPEHVTK